MPAQPSIPPQLIGPLLYANWHHQRGVVGDALSGKIHSKFPALSSGQIGTVVGMVGSIEDAAMLVNGGSPDTYITDYAIPGVEGARGGFADVEVDITDTNGNAKTYRVRVPFFPSDRIESIYERGHDIALDLARNSREVDTTDDVSIAGIWRE